MIYAIIHRGKEFENVAHRRLGPRERAGGSIFNGRPTAGKVEDGDRPQRAFFLLRRLATLRRRLLIHSQWEMAICQAMGHRHVCCATTGCARDQLEKRNSPDARHATFWPLC